MASTSRGSEVDDTCREKAEEPQSSSTSTAASLKVQTSGEVRREREREQCSFTACYNVENSVCVLLCDIFKE